jgi:Tol biopolymer transport system component
MIMQPARALALTMLVAACGQAAESPAEPTQPPTTPPTTPPAVTLPASLAGAVVFVRGEGSSEVMMAIMPGGEHVRLGGHTGSSPHVSRDGRRLVYSPQGGGIAVLDLAARSNTVLTTELSPSPRWSPDGSRILFWSRRTGSQELWTMRPDGSGLAQLTNGGGYHEADWSPDGARIVFRRVDSDPGDLWTISANGTGAAPLYIAPRMQLNPRWSPDGRRIAFNGMVLRSTGVGVTSKVFVIDADGSNLRQLTHGDLDDWGADWSPDGSRITFFRKITDPDNDLLSVEVATGDLQVIVDGPTNDYHPSFGPAR